MIIKSMWKYTKAIAHSKSGRAIGTKRKQLIKSIERAITKIKKTNGYDGDDYKNKVLAQMQLNKPT